MNKYISHIQKQFCECLTSLTVVGERAVVGEGDDHIEHGDAVSKSVQTAEVFAQVVQQLRHNSTHVTS